MSRIEERTRQLEVQKEEIERDFPIKIDVQLSYRSDFTGGEAEIVMLSFIFGAIATGFFSAIGRDIWSKAKDFCGKIVQSQRKRQDNSRTTILAVFDYGGHQITVSLERLDRKKWEAISSLYNMDPVHLFWEELPTQVLEIIELIDKKSENLAGIKTIKVELSDIERKWVIIKT